MRLKGPAAAAVRTSDRAVALARASEAGRAGANKSRKRTSGGGGRRGGPLVKGAGAAGRVAVDAEPPEAEGEARAWPRPTMAYEAAMLKDVDSSYVFTGPLKVGCCGVSLFTGRQSRRRSMTGELAVKSRHSRRSTSAENKNFTDPYRIVCL